MHRIALALGLLAVACSRTVERHGAPDASDASGAGGHGGSGGTSAAGMSAAGSGGAMSSAGAMSDAAAAGGDGACFDPAGVPACEIRGLRRAVLEAASLGEGVRFTHANGQVLLARRETAAGSSQLVVRVGNTDHGEEPVVLEIERDDETAGYVAVDAADARYLPGSDANIIALLCDGEACALFGANAANDSALRPLPGGAVPSGVGARGLNEHIDERACVYGTSGYACFDGSAWDPRQLEGVSLRYMSTQGYWTVAGDHGALYGLYAEDQGTLEPIATGLDDTLVWATVDNTGCWTAITAEGRPVQGSCTIASPLPCDESIELPRYLEHYSLQTKLVTRDGTLYRRNTHSQTGEHAWCSYPSVGGEVIDVTSAPCGLESNPLLLTASALYVVNYWGEIACPVG